MPLTGNAIRLDRRCRADLAGAASAVHTRQGQDDAFCRFIIRSVEFVWNDPMHLFWQRRRYSWCHGRVAPMRDPAHLSSRSFHCAFTTRRQHPKPVCRQHGTGRTNSSET
jgi:hypothetical protein